MAPVYQILYKSLVAPFYRQNALLFIAVAFLMFGIQRSVAELLLFHRSIILSVLTRPLFLGIFTLVWFIYVFKVMYWLSLQLKKTTFSFLFHITALPVKLQYRLLLRLIFYWLIPLLVYLLPVTVIAIYNGLWVGLSAVTIITAVMVVAMFLTFRNWLQQAGGLQTIAHRSYGNATFIKPSLFRFSGRYLLQQQLPALLLIKIISFLLLYFLSRVDEGVFEGRMLWLIFVALILGHYLIVYRLFYFVEKEMFFYRNLPLKNYKLLLVFLLIYILILLPEAWALLGVAIQQQQWSNYWGMLCCGPAILLLLHSLLYSNDMQVNEFLNLMAGIGVVLLFCGMGIPLWLLAFFITIFAVAVFTVSYKSFEMKEQVGGLK